MYFLLNMWIFQPAILIYHQDSHPFPESCVSSVGLTTWCVRTVGVSPLSAWVSQQMIWRMWDLKILCHWRRLKTRVNIVRFPLRRLEDVIVFDIFCMSSTTMCFFCVCVASTASCDSCFCRHATVLLLYMLPIHMLRMCMLHMCTVGIVAMQSNALYSNT